MTYSKYMARTYENLFISVHHNILSGDIVFGEGLALLKTPVSLSPFTSQLQL